MHDSLSLLKINPQNLIDRGFVSAIDQVFLQCTLRQAIMLNRAACLFMNFPHAGSHWNQNMTFENGKISSWNDDKGFGFITPKSGGKTIFIHINDFSKKHKRPMQGLSVNYQLSTDSNGRRCAINVYPKRGHKKVNKSDRQLSFSVFLSITFLCVVGGLVVLNKLPVIILGIYAIVSVLTFALYAKDKSAAQSGRWRTSESTLHLFSLIGGWPGAIIAQNKLRHKSNKTSFRVVYWVTVIINCGVLGWLLTLEGTNRLNMILNHINIG